MEEQQQNQESLKLQTRLHGPVAEHCVDIARNLMAIAQRLVFVFE
jgi:hypothetical protein